MIEADKDRFAAEMEMLYAAYNRVCGPASVKVWWKELREEPAKCVWPALRDARLQDKLPTLKQVKDMATMRKHAGRNREPDKEPFTDEDQARGKAFLGRLLEALDDRSGGKLAELQAWARRGCRNEAPQKHLSWQNGETLPEEPPF